MAGNLDIMEDSHKQAHCPASAARVIKVISGRENLEISICLAFHYLYLCESTLLENYHIHSPAKRRHGKEESGGRARVCCKPQIMLSVKLLKESVHSKWDIQTEL